MGQSGLRKPRACEVCGTEYTPTYGAQRTCGRVCGIALRRAAATPATCTQCGAAFTVHTASRPPSTCGADCPAAPIPATPEADCGICGRRFLSPSGTRLCSPECRAERKRQQDREYNRKRSPGPPHCMTCGVELPMGRKKCGACLQGHRAMRRRQDKRRRHALKLGVATEKYTLAEIAARDGNRCGLCRRRVRMHLAVPHPHAPTVDHIVPLARGGDDTRANVQLAHFICNCTKRDHGTQQLALVG